MTDARTSRRRRASTIGLIAIAAMLVIGFGALRWPIEPRSGSALNGAPPAEFTRRDFRIASFNIQSGRGDDGVTDLARTAELLRAFDVIALNEIRGQLIGTPANQAADLGERLHLAWMFNPAERRWWHDDFGNGLLSRAPLSRFVSTPLPGTQLSGHRQMIVATLRIADADVNLLFTHLDRTVDRGAQLEIVRKRFLELPPPAILLGDLNTQPGDPLMQALLASAGVIDPIGDTLGPKTPRVDWILTRGLQTIEANLRENPASDHPLIWAHLKLPDSVSPAPPSSQPSR